MVGSGEQDLVGARAEAAAAVEDGEGGSEYEE